jgi:hypothetical protein
MEALDAEEQLEDAEGNADGQGLEGGFWKKWSSILGTSNWSPKHSPLSSVKEGHPNHFSLLISDYDVIVGYLGVVGMAWFLEVDIEDICFLIVIHPNLLVRDVQQVWYKS